SRWPSEMACSLHVRQKTTEKTDSNSLEFLIRNNWNAIMTIETKLDLNEDTLDHLQTLIRINIDSCDGLKESAEQIEDQTVAGVFRELARERMQLAKELQIYCEWNGEEPR